MSSIDPMLPAGYVRFLMDLLAAAPDWTDPTVSSSDEPGSRS